jgi:hypothetical protein
MVESPVSYLESMVPTVAYDIAIVFGPAGYAGFTRRVLSIYPPSLPPPLPPHARHGKKEDH